jgi:hypothetical protein
MAFGLSRFPGVRAVLLFTERASERFKTDILVFIRRGAHPPHI